MKPLPWRKKSTPPPNPNSPHASPFVRSAKVVHSYLPPAEGPGDVIDWDQHNQQKKGKFVREKIIHYIRAGYPGLYLVSAEEQRVEVELKSIAKEIEFGLFVWSVTNGLIDTSKG